MSKREYSFYTAFGYRTLRALESGEDVVLAFAHLPGRAGQNPRAAAQGLFPGRAGTGGRRGRCASLAVPKASLCRYYAGTCGFSVDDTRASIAL